AGEHLLGLINDVLSISKIEAGEATLTLTTFDLRRVLRGLQEMFQLRAQGKGIGLRFEVPATLPAAVEGDNGKLRQVLINVTGKAIKFTRVGTVALYVRWANGRATFTVEDTGRGMTPEELRRVFRPFVQLPAAGDSVEGTGLGLSITQSFIQL